jgi:hypothetical protein
MFSEVNQVQKDKACMFMFSFFSPCKCMVYICSLLVYKELFEGWVWGLMPVIILIEEGRISRNTGRCQPGQKVC